MSPEPLTVSRREVFLSSDAGLFVSVLPRSLNALTAKLVKHATLNIYKGFPHGMPTTEAAAINADPLAFIKS
jgi:hypothetical protein